MNTPPTSTPDLTRPDPSDPPYLQGLNGPQRQAVGYLVLARRLPMRRSTAAAPVLRADPFAAVAANDVG